MLRVERIMAGPIDNLLVIEASEAMPGAMAAMLLADHGAEVIKVEPAGGSVFARDLTRKGWDRGKQSVELDVNSADGRDQLGALLKTADIFIHSYGEREAASLGLDTATLARNYPTLVTCVISAYGQGTPFSERPYGESLAAALLGTMIDRGSSFRPGPLYLGHPALHYGQAFLAAIGSLAAIRARRHTGRGQCVDASLV